MCVTKFMNTGAYSCGKRGGVRPAAATQPNCGNGAGQDTSIRGIRSTGQFMVAPPQQRLYFFPEPHGQRSFRPTLGALRRGWGVKAEPIWPCRCSLK